MSNKMKVLSISLDASEMSQSQIEELQTAIEAQTENYDLSILNSAIKEIDIDELMEEEEDSKGLH